jgi:ATP-dependent RNA helicase DHX37/DHR1
MEEIHKLRAQITNIVRLYFPDTNVDFSPKLPPPSKIQVSILQPEDPTERSSLFIA